MCEGPRPLLQAIAGVNPPGQFQDGAPVALNGGGGAGNPLPVAQPQGLDPDPGAALQGAPAAGGADDQAIPLIPQGAGGGMDNADAPLPVGDAGGMAGAFPAAGQGPFPPRGGNYYVEPVPTVFNLDDSEALTYYHRAELLGHPMADVYTTSLRNSIAISNADSRKIIADAEKRALYWTPPYEFYQGVTAGGSPHSDESLPSLEQRIALGRVGEIPGIAIAKALDFRRYTKHGRGCGPPFVCYRAPIMQFQSALGYEPTGVLTPPQIVRLIQMAAVDGDAVSQDRLGIMYAKGIGVPQNFVRAEKWFINAANQHNADALFNLYVLYKVGPNGIEQDEHKAVSYNIQALAAGYNRLFCELQDLLRQADDRHDHADGARR
jgi:TPR repeat protein